MLARISASTVSTSPVQPPTIAFLVAYISAVLLSMRIPASRVHASSSVMYVSAFLSMSSTLAGLMPDPPPPRTYPPRAEDDDAPPFTEFSMYTSVSAVSRMLLASVSRTRSGSSYALPVRTASMRSSIATP